MRTEKELRRSNWYGAKPFVASAMSLPGVSHLTHAVASRILPANKLHRLPVGASQSRFRLESGERVILLDPRVDLIAKDIHWGKGRATSKSVQHILRWVEARAARAEQFVDIGAYSAFFSLIAAKSNPKLRALAFEIVPENFFQAVSNVIANDLLPQIEVRLCGIGYDQEFVRIPSFAALSSHPPSVSLSMDAPDGVTVPVRTLDSFNLSGRMLWKIDVELHEWSVFQGAAETIRTYKPDIVCEILLRFKHAEDIERMLRPLGYRFFVARDSGLEERDTLKPEANRDWVFTTTP